MTIWTPTLDPALPPDRALAAAIEADRAAGRLKAGDRLPPQRDLAYRLGLSLGAVTRGYNEAARLGLTRGEVGRGTFIRAIGERSRPQTIEGPLAEPDILDLTITRPALGGIAGPISAALAELALSTDLESLIDYAEPAGRPEHRAAVADWITDNGVAMTPDRVVLANGAQNGIALAVASLFRPGDSVAADTLTYAGFKSAAAAFGVSLIAAAGDDQGMTPEALEEAARNGARGVYLMPTLHNPTMATMPLVRRRALIDVAERFDLVLIEDDVYGFLQPDAPPRFATLAPDRTTLIGSVSKFMAPALRVGWIAPPERRVADVSAMLRSLAWMASPLSTDVAARAIRSGMAAEMAAAQREEAEARIAIARKRLGPWVPTLPKAAMHVWLPLPSPWRADDFVAEAAARKVALTSAGAFAVGRGRAPHAVRFGLGPASRERLDAGLEALAGLLSKTAHAGAAVV